MHEAEVAPDLLQRRSVDEHDEDHERCFLRVERSGSCQAGDAIRMEDLNNRHVHAY
jgi:hypothetical protein